MSWRAMRWVMTLTASDGLTQAGKMVLLGLANHANRDSGLADPPTAALATFAIIDQRSVRRILSRLVRKGLVELDTGRVGGRAMSARYRIVIPRWFGTNGSGGGHENPDSESSFTPQNPDSESAFRENNPDIESSFPRNPDIESSFSELNPDSESSFTLTNASKPGLITPQNPDSESALPSKKESKKVSEESEREARAPAQGSISIPLNKDWKPSEEGRRFATELGLDPDAVFPLFSAYYRSRNGDAGLSPNWDATWQVWCIREVDRNQRRAGQQAHSETRPPRSPRETPMQAYRRRLDEEEAAELAAAAAAQVLQ